jgi:hypothetical protein
VRPAVVWTDQHVLLKAEVLCDGGGFASVTAPSLPRHGPDGPAALRLASIEEDSDLLAIAVSVLKAVVQIRLISRHDQ